MATRKNNFPAFTREVQRKLEKGMAQSLILGASEASVMTPIDTSTLMNSQYKTVATVGDKVIGEVGYTAAYAGYAHDPDVEQNFRRPSAEKEFLKKGFENAEPNIKAVISGAIRI